MSRFLLKCKSCGYEFLPWKCFSMVTPETGWKQGYFCPECGKLNIFND